MHVAIINYGAGNLASVTKAFRAVGATPTVVEDPSEISSSRALVVPGVGHFDATRALHERWRRAIGDRLDAGAALLGICLGMQWLFEGSDEAPDLPGLGIFPGRCARLRGAGVKVPHVGWNTLTPIGVPSRLMAGAGDAPYVYFTHAFAAPVSEGCVATTTHGSPFASVVERGRVCGVQWHPEKSSDAGLIVVRAFLTLAEEAA